MKYSNKRQHSGRRHTVPAFPFPGLSTTRKGGGGGGGLATTIALFILHGNHILRPQNLASRPDVNGRFYCTLSSSDESLPDVESNVCGSVEHDVDDRPPGVRRQLLGRGDEVSRRVVDDDGRQPQRTHALTDRRLHTVRLSYIRRCRDHLETSNIQHIQFCKFLNSVAERDR